jgi:hypothetical protein
MHPAAEFIVAMFGPHPDGRVYVATLPNPENKGTKSDGPDELHVLSRSSAQITDFVTRHDQPGEGCFACVATIQDKATRRAEKTVAQIVCLHAEIDFRQIQETPEEAERVIVDLPLSPSRAHHSGHGLHLYWFLKTAIVGTPESSARHKQLLRCTADYLGGDLAACLVHQLLRLPGTTNSKNGEQIPVRVLVDRPDLRYDYAELERWIAAAGAPLLRHKTAAGNGESPDNPFLAFATKHTSEVPLDVERMLAEIIYLGPGGGGNAHDTLLRCTAALIRRGVPIDAVVAKGLEALQEAAARSGAGLDPVQARRTVEEMARSAAEKFPPEPESKSEPEPWQPLATVYVCPEPSRIPPREFLFGRHYIRGFVTATIAPGGTGKSSRSLAEAIAMVTARSFLGEMPRYDPLRVWYYGEDPKDELDRRIAAILQHYGIPMSEIGDRLCVDSLHDLRLKELAISKPDRSGPKVIFNERLVRDLVETFRTRELDAAIFDPLVTLHSVPENDPASMDAIVRKFGVIAEQVRSAIDLVHHTRKPAGGQAGMTVDDARGARAIIDAARAARVLNRMSSKEAEAADIEPDDCWRYFRSDTGKANMAPPEVAGWSELVSVVIANGDNVGVTVPWTYPGVLDGVTPQDVQWIRELVRTEPDHAYSPNTKTWIGYALAERLGLDAEDKADRAKLRKILKAWFANGVLARDPRIVPESRKMREFVKPGEWKEGPDQEP